MSADPRTYDCAMDAGRSRVTRKSSRSIGPSFTVKATGMDGYRGDLLRVYVSPDGTWEVHARDTAWDLSLVASGQLPD